MNDADRKPNEPRDPGHEKAVRSEQLFGDKKEIVIEHEGERYRLRITRRNKLILQK